MLEKMLGRNNRTLCRLLSVGALLGLSACGGGEIFKTFNITTDDEVGRNAGVSVDARQRTIIATDIQTSSSPFGQVKPKQILCSEPSPDVAITMAQAFSAGLGGSLSSGDSASAAMAFASSESLAELGRRTATVQLLRDLFYRACEAYANGAISASEYSLMMSRVDNFAVTLLLAEAAATTTAGKGAILASGDVTAESKITLPGGENETDGEAQSAEADAKVNKITGKQSESTGVKVDFGAIATQIAKVHQQYLDRGRDSEVISACLSAMDRRIVKKVPVGLNKESGKLVSLIDGKNFKAGSGDVLHQYFVDNDNENESDKLSKQITNMAFVELIFETPGPRTQFIEFCHKNMEDLVDRVKR